MIIIKNLKIFLIHLVFIFLSFSFFQFKWAISSEVEINSAESFERAREYIDRYKLDYLNEKLVDNFGDGFLPLYGTRNFRVVLNGVLYRGGANNYYNKNKKRDNMNPLPEEGLENLCQENFKSSIYLYKKNFSNSKNKFSCKNFKAQNNELQYLQMTAFDQENTHPFLEKIYRIIKHQEPGPLYIHCWNGWHASGLISTLALRQFCGLDSSTGLKYWAQNTDGHSNGYEKVKQRIKEFIPYPDLHITQAEKEIFCPRLTDIKF